MLCHLDRCSKAVAVDRWQAYGPLLSSFASAKAAKTTTFCVGGLRSFGHKVEQRKELALFCNSAEHCQAPKAFASCERLDSLAHSFAI